MLATEQSFTRTTGWGEQLSDRESPRASTFQAGVGNSEMTGPVFHTHRPALVCEHDVTTRVACLNSTRDPATVFKPVTAIVVDAVEGMFRCRPRAHVFEECRELLPALAHLDPTSSVAGPGFGVRVTAPILHRRPDRVFRRLTEAVRSIACDRSLPLEASATSDLHEAGLRHLLFGPTLTSDAHPVGDHGRRDDVTDDSESAVRPACEISPDQDGFVVQASTASCPSTAQASQQYGMGISAFALAQPAASTFPGRGPPHDRESSKYVTSEIERLHGANIPPSRTGVQ